jgi:hypothetical protein
MVHKVVGFNRAFFSLPENKAYVLLKKVSVMSPNLSFLWPL